MSPPKYRPYGDEEAANTLYHLLFCDDPEEFRAASKGDPGRLAPIFAARADEAALRAIADDDKIESRLRMLAANRMRKEGFAAPQKRLHGVIAEVPMEGGLDVLAAYADGRIRYINQTSKMTIIEGESPHLSEMVTAVFDSAKLLIARIGPWTKDRLPPPDSGRTRLTFLVSDGVYFGEGPIADLGRDPLAGPVLLAAAELLNATVEVTLAAQAKNAKR
ncbi:MAG: hypothetical protein ABL889_22895 [Terricaulis sp.]